eukprot:scaffold237026_cov13-Tisochrysis_lutea.AAC.1
MDREDALFCGQDHCQKDSHELVVSIVHDLANVALLAANASARRRADLARTAAAVVAADQAHGSSNRMFQRLRGDCCTRDKLHKELCTAGVPCGHSALVLHQASITLFECPPRCAFHILNGKLPATAILIPAAVSESKR